MKKTMVIVGAVFFIFLFCTGAYAGILYVDADATGSNNGSGWADAYTGLQAALSAAVSGDEIRVAQGTYYPTAEHGGSGDRFKSFQMVEGVAIYGGYAGFGETDPDRRDIEANVTILSGDIGTADDITDNCYHVFYHPEGLALTPAAVLSGFTIKGGKADGASPHMRGGGMYNVSAAPTLTHCSFSGNSAYYGGGMRNDTASPTLKNCTFSGNQADFYGGGMHNNTSSPSLANCTFSGNEAGSEGGGLHNGNSSAPDIVNCILWGNTAATGNEVHHDDSSSPIFSYCDIGGSGGSAAWDTGLGTDSGNNIDSDPLFESDGLHLTVSSPCIDAGNNSTITTETDIDGETRIVDGNSDETATADIGADEFVDTDGDGLSDYSEKNTYGTDAADSDSDDDGLSDYDEVNTYSTDPTTADAGADTDGDGLSNVDEVNTYGTDPTHSDTDGDGYGDRVEVLHGSSPTEMSETPSGGITLYVDADATVGSNDSTSWENAFTCLQSALTSSLAGDEIRVAKGTYYPTVEHGGSGDRYKSFQMVEGVAIYGGYAGTGEDDPDSRDIETNVTILSGDIGTTGVSTDNCYHVFYHPDGLALTPAAVLSGFTITGGNANENYPHNTGSGMYNSGSSPTITNCVFSGNEGSYSGGMFNDKSSPAITNCMFSGNSVGFGGGMYNYSSSPTLTNCTFTGNSANLRGGGMYNYSSSPTLTNCTFTGNSANEGGGMYNIFSSSPRVTNCILWGDTATLSGNEVYNTDSSTATFSHCDVEGGVSGLGTDSGGNIDVNPVLNGLHLTSSSPCINAGDNTAAEGIESDMDGEARMFNGTVDIGADEFMDTDSDSMPDYQDTDDDSDGLSDSLEAALGTDPLKADTDGDGLNDFQEWSYWGNFWNADPDGDSLINILDSDSDGDGIGDGVEYITGTWDTDGDGVIDRDDTFPYDASESLDSDNDGTGDSADQCPDDPDKIEQGICGCGVADIDSDNDGIYNCEESPAIVTTIPSGTTSEIGNTASFTVKLKSPPDGDVILTVSSDDPSEGRVSPDSLIFTSDNWNASQVVTVTGNDDDFADGNQAFNIELDVYDDATEDTTGYTDLNTVAVSVTNVDDETAGFTISKISGVTSEDGDSAAFVVRLNSQPTEDVTISVSSDDATEGTVSPSTLIFSPDNWNAVGHIVIVTGLDDDLADGDIFYTIVLGAAISYDESYDGLDPADVTVTNTDNDSPGITVSAIDGNTSETGDAAEFTIVLFTRPMSDVTITLTSSNTAEGTVSPASVTFTPVNWNVAQTVTVTGVDDDSVDGNQEYTIQTGAATSSDAHYDGLDPSDVTVTNTDNETPQTSSGGEGSSGGGGGCFIGTLGLR